MKRVILVRVEETSVKDVVNAFVDHLFRKDQLEGHKIDGVCDFEVSHELSIELTAARDIF